jgi:hypothetical protein
VRMRDRLYPPRALSFLPAVVLLLLGILAAILAADVRSWHATLETGDALYRVSPQAPTWRTRSRFPFSTAETLLGVGDDVKARRAIQLFRQAEPLRPRLDTALQVQAARARAEDALAAVARGRDRARASQASALLGILAFGDLPTGATGASEAESAVAPFQNAVRLDAGNEAAKFDLEVVLRLLAPKGTRVNPGTGSGTGPTGRRGAGGGTPGRGY